MGTRRGMDPNEIKRGTPTLIMHVRHGARPGEIESVVRDADGRIMKMTARDESDGQTWSFWDLGDGIYRGVGGWTLDVGHFDFAALEPDGTTVVFRPGPFGSRGPADRRERAR